MNTTDMRDAAVQAVAQSKNIVARQIDRQAATLGTTLSQTARDLEQIGTHLAQNGAVASAGELAQRASMYVDRAADYLQTGNTDDFIADLETLARERPWAVAASTAVLGFVAARIVKSSSARRFYGAGGI